MMTHWNVSDFAALAGGIILGHDASMPMRILSDSRDVIPGDAFIALPGTQQDGHTFLKDAVKRGASILIGSNENALKCYANEQTCVILKDTENSIVLAAQKYIEIINPRIISVTGSVGKTTTRECIYEVLTSKYKVHRPFRSYNTNIGCALTILSMPVDTDILVLEMGANHENEIASMVSVFPPEVAVITEAAAAHLEGFKDIESVISAKCEIYKNSKTKVLFYNSDRIELRSKISNDTKIIEKNGVGIEHSCYSICSPDFSIYQNEPKMSFILRTKKDEYNVRSKFIGIHNAYPLSFALSIGEYYNVNKNAMLESILQMEPIDGRGVYIKLKNNVVLLDDSYNANPISMKAALNALKSIKTKGEKIAVLGEMKELGNDSISYHESLLSDASFCDFIILYGNTWDNILKDVKNHSYNSKVTFCNKLEQTYIHVTRHMERDNILLIKGSHSNNLESLVSIIKRDYHL